MLTMAGIITKEGYKRELLNFINQDMTIKLYVNDYTPTYDTVLTDLVELDSNVYTPVNITSTDWGSPVVETDRIYVQLNNDITFTFSSVPASNNTVYGYFIVNSNNELLMVERLSSPFTITNSGDSITLSGITIEILLV